jgi:HD superfamily phosphohydrolase
MHQPWLEITDSMEKSLVVAGLCHNIGHGPYSYPFTDAIRELLNDKSWDSNSTCMTILEDLIDTNSIDMSSDEINMTKDILTGEKLYTLKSDQNSSVISNKDHKDYPLWILQILNNKTNGVDVDKFDFIRRDTYKLGCPNESFDGDILINHARVLDNNICYREKDAFSIYELFNCRYRLFKEFYIHRVSKGIDLMIKDIFLEANTHYNFLNYLEDPKKFITLKDSIINDIKNSEEDELQTAKSIVKRIYQRKLYKFVGEKNFIISNFNNDDYEKFFNFKEEDILNFSHSSGYQEENLKLGDIKILKCKLNFGKNEEDPVDYVKFYSKKKNYDLTPENNYNEMYQNMYEIKNIEKKNISLLTPRCFEEFILRVYVKEEEKLESAKKAFEKFCCEKTGESPNHYGKRSANKNDKIKNTFN